MTERAPNGLERRGKAFWREVQSEYVLAAPERELLLECCRTLDLVEKLQGQLEAQPRAATELRLQRIVLGKLLAQLGIPAEKPLETLATIRARKAATSRWAGHVKRSAS